VARGKVVKAGKRLIVTSCEVVHIGPDEGGDGKGGKETLCAVLQQTLVPVEKKY
jgi:acyl-coenzyme A thioesterase PaaI-like protein